MKYTCEMNREMKRVMNQLVLDLNVDTYAQVFRKAIALLLVAQKAQNEGKILAITEAGKIEKVLVMEK